MRSHKSGVLALACAVAFVLGSASGQSVTSPTSSSAACPVGGILLWSGLLSTIPAYYQLCDGTNGTPDLRNSFVKCVAAGEDPGATGGAASVSYTPAGTCSVPTFSGSALAGHAHGVGTYAAAAPTFSGDALAGHAHGIGTYAAANESAHTHSVTAAGTNATAVFTPTGTMAAPTFTGSSGTVPAQVVSWPAGVPTFSGSALATHTHTAGTYADATSGTGVKLFTVSTLSASAATLSGNSGATSGGTPAGTVAWPAGVPTNATASFTPAGTCSAPAFTGSAGTVPAETFTGSAVTSGAGSAHTHTLSGSSASVSGGTPSGTNSAPTLSGSSASVSAGTPAGTVTAPTFTGSAATIATEPVYFKLAYIMRLK